LDGKRKIVDRFWIASLADRTAAFSKAAFPEVKRLQFLSGEGA
jgi:hypothetical protein